MAVTVPVPSPAPVFASFLQSLCVALQRQPASSRSPGWLRLFIRLYDESRSGDLGAAFAMWAIVPAVGMQGMMFRLQLPDQASQPSSSPSCQ